MFEIRVDRSAAFPVCELAGDLDASSTGQAQQVIGAEIVPNGGVLIDMAEVKFMSSAGLRVLLGTYRMAKEKNCAVVITGLSAEILDTMAITGFRDYFAVRATREEGFAMLEEGRK